MSFSGNIKEELEKIIVPARHCQLSELAAIYDFCCKKSEENSDKMVISSENELAVRKCFTLLKKTFNMNKDFSWDDCKDSRKGASYRIVIEEKEIVERVRNAISTTMYNPKSCCKRAYIRGAFLAAGSVSDPNKSYHFEIVCQDESRAQFLAEMLLSFEIDAKVITRKNHFVLYVKDGTGIVETLNVMGAHVALMDFENTRILKEMRNSVNRKVNCETANIGKTITAAQRQIEDIRILMDSPLYRTLPDTLKSMAQMRTTYPDYSLKELGELFVPPLGKSGVNHRLRKLGELASVVKEENDDKKGNSYSVGKRT